MKKNNFLNEVLFICVLLFLSIATGISQDYIYWTSLDRHHIQRGNLETKKVETIIGSKPVVKEPKVKAIDGNNNIVYWEDINAFADSMVFYKTTPTETIKLFAYCIEDINNEQLVDIEGQKIYWRDDSRSIFEYDIIKEENKTLINTSFQGEAQFPTIDIVRGKIYWYTNSTRQIKRANLDGSEAEAVISIGKDLPSRRTNYRLASFALDLKHQKIYYTITHLGASTGMFRCNLDGTKNEIYSYYSLGTTIKIDTIHNKIYWSSPANLGKIYRGNLNGVSLIEEILKDYYPSNYYLDAPRDRIYWKDSRLNAIQSTNLDGTELVTLTDVNNDTLARQGSVFFDFANQRIYWLDKEANLLRGANLDGTDIQDFPMEVSSPHSFQFDAVNETLFWIDGVIKKINLKDGTIEEPYPQIDSTTNDFLLNLTEEEVIAFSSNSIQKIKLDGNDPQTLIHSSKVSQPTKLTLHKKDKKLYWYDSKFQGIQRANLDGSEIEDVIKINSIFEIDELNDKVYWRDKENGIDLIKSIQLDGTNEKIIVELSEKPESLQLDIEDNKIYWVNKELGKIQRASLDGTEQEDLVINIAVVDKLQLNLQTRKMFWLNSEEGIFIANLDGTNQQKLSENTANNLALDNNNIVWGFDNAIHSLDIENSKQQILLSNLIERPTDVTIDEVNKKMYWAESGSWNIKRANLDGTAIEIILGALGGILRPHRIALDINSNKIYWANFSQGKIQRMNFDRSNVQNLVDNLSKPDEVLLDLDKGKMYWTEYGGNIIKRANLGGTNIESLVFTGERPISLVINHTVQKLYWLEQGDSFNNGTIRQANLDGSNKETILANLRTPFSLVFDEKVEKFYWAENDSGEIWRANIDGTEKELLFEDLLDVYDISLNLSNVTTSTKIINETFSITVQPNPVINQLTIDLHDDQIEVFNWKLFDVQGQNLKQSAYSNQQGDLIIDMMTVPQGTYFLHLITSKGDWSTKVIKQE